MANSKISALTSATTPLAGTETLPVVQSSTTKQVSVANLTAGRAISATGYTIEYNTGLYANDATISNYSSTNGVYVNGNAGGWLNLSGDGTRKQTIVLYGGASNDIVMSTAAVERLRVAASNVTFTGVNLIQGTAAKGINFTANTPAAGMTSQLLNWYEEGTWTPNQGAGLTVIGAFTSSGTYTRIGRCVTISGQVNGATSIATSSNGAISTNLPFTVGSKNYIGSMMNGTASVGGNCYAAPSTTILVSVTALAASSNAYFTVTYFV